MEKDLRPYQRVSFDGVLYYLTRLMLGLNSSPKITMKNLNGILTKDEHVKIGADRFIQNIIVIKDLVSRREVVEHLTCCGVEAKALEKLDGVEFWD